jgi:hypothetical protein
LGYKMSTVKKVILWIWIAVRMPIFLILLWLRIPAIFICKLVSLLMLIAWLFAWYAFPDKTSMVWGFGTISLIAFVVIWAYDLILIAISPPDMMKII